MSTSVFTLPSSSRFLVFIIVFLPYDFRAKRVVVWRERRELQSRLGHQRLPDNRIEAKMHQIIEENTRESAHTHTHTEVCKNKNDWLDSIIEYVPTNYGHPQYPNKHGLLSCELPLSRVRVIHQSVSVPAAIFQVINRYL